jgi:Tfp pilus assembly protein PilZ
VQAQPEFRRSGRLGHECIIKLEDDQTLSPYYAVSYNLSETGMYLKSLFELHPGAHILVRIDDYILDQNLVPAKVVWCKNLGTTASFRYGVGVEFLKSEKNVGMYASLPIAPQMKTQNTNKGGVVVKMKKHSPEHSQDNIWHRISE